MVNLSNVKGFDESSFNAGLDFKFKQKHVFSFRNNPMSGVTFQQWIEILNKYFSAIEFRYYPRTIFITLLSLFNSFLGFWEWIFFEQRIAKTMVPCDPVFIIGHPRTGTTLLHNLLSSDENNFFYCSTFCVGFPSCFLWFEKWGKHLFSSVLDKTRPMDSMPLHFDLPGEDELATNLLSSGKSYYMPLWFMCQEPQFRRFSDFSSENGATPDDEICWTRAFLYLVQKITLRAQIETEKKGDRNKLPRRLLLKSPVHAFRVPLLRRIFPKAKFIYMHRHPCEVLQSAAHMADTTYWYCYLNTPSDDEIKQFIFWQFGEMWKAYNAAAILSGSSVNSSFPKTEKHQENFFASKGKSVKNANLQNKSCHVDETNLSHRYVLSQKQSTEQESQTKVKRVRPIASDIIEISYETLVTNPIHTLQSIYKHTGVRWTESTCFHYTEQATVISQYQPNRHAKLNKKAVQEIKMLWQTYFEEFEYE